jgi:GNAT superfamily N-acetyltransferase
MMGVTVAVETTLSAEWWDVYTQAAGYQGLVAEVRAGILKRIGPAAGFALAAIDGVPVAVGLGVAERGWLGLFCMVTLPAYRRRGAAGAVLHALANWGQQQTISDLYLQVEVDNQPALALYGQAGFATVYHYWYAWRDDEIK